MATSETKEKKEPKESEEAKENKEPKEHREKKESKASEETKENKEPKEHREKKGSKESKESRESAEAATEEGAPKGKRIRKVKKERKSVPNGIAFIQATFNNTVVTITDLKGNVIAWASAGKMGFKGAKKSTPYAAQIIASNAGQKAMDISGLQEVEVRVKGPGGGREAAIRALHAVGLRVRTIKDITPIPHNGCRPRKRRRV